MRKTSMEMLTDSYERASIQPLNIYELNEYSYVVFNELTHSEYVIEIDNESMYVINCTCRHYIYRCKDAGIACKHMVAVADYLNYRV